MKFGRKSKPSALDPGQSTCENLQIFQQREAGPVLGEHFVDRVENHQPRFSEEQVPVLPCLQPARFPRVILQVFELQLSPREQRLFRVDHDHLVALLDADALVDRLVLPANYSRDLRAHVPVGHSFGVENVIDSSVALDAVLGGAQFLVGEGQRVGHHVLVVGLRNGLHEGAVFLDVVDAHVLAHVNVVELADLVFPQLAELRIVWSYPGRAFALGPMAAHL